MQATSGREKRGGALDNGRPRSRTLGKKNCTVVFGNNHQCYH